MPTSAPSEHFMDMDVLRSMYQDALKSGCSPAFADKYIVEAARSMVLAEAMSISTGAGVMESIISNANITGSPKK